jgi:hypothetical protein
MGAGLNILPEPPQCPFTQSDCVKGYSVAICKVCRIHKPWISKRIIKEINEWYNSISTSLGSKGAGERRSTSQGMYRCLNCGQLGEDVKQRNRIDGQRPYLCNICALLTITRKVYIRKIIPKKTKKLLQRKGPI